MAFSLTVVNRAGLRIYNHELWLLFLEIGGKKWWVLIQTKHIYVIFAINSLYYTSFGKGEWGCNWIFEHKLKVYAGLVLSIKNEKESPYKYCTDIIFHNFILSVSINIWNPETRRTHRSPVQSHLYKIWKSKNFWSKCQS